MEKSQSLTFMNYQKKHFVIMKRNIIWLLCSELKHWSVTNHVSAFVSSMEIGYFSEASGAYVNCNIYFDSPCLYFSWTSYHWDFLSKTGLQKCPGRCCWPSARIVSLNYSLEAFCKPGLPSVSSVISSLIISIYPASESSLMILLMLSSLLTIVWDLLEIGYSMHILS